MNLEIGKQYKTRGGWRAVVVKYNDSDDITVWHEFDDRTYGHKENGRKWSGMTDNYDIISEWVEPRKGEFWVNVYDAHDGVKFGGCHASRKLADSVSKRDINKRIACVRREWTEGEGLEGGR